MSPVSKSSSFLVRTTLRLQLSWTLWRRRRAQLKAERQLQRALLRLATLQLWTREQLLAMEQRERAANPLLPTPPTPLEQPAQPARMPVPTAPARPVPRLTPGTGQVLDLTSQPVPPEPATVQVARELGLLSAPPSSAS